MQNAKCTHFKGVRDYWDPWSLEWLEFAQVMQGVTGVEKNMALGNLLKMYVEKATRARWAAKEAKGSSMTYDALCNDLIVMFGLNARGCRRGAWESLKREFTGKGISRGSWEICMADFERLAAELDIQE